MTEKKTPALHERIVKAMKGEIAPAFDPDLIRELSALLDETGLTEIEIERAGVRVRVAKGGVVGAAPVHAAAAPQTAPAAQTVPAAEPKKEGTILTSPMVGTVYLTPEPNSPPFIKIGDRVTDQTVCIIEAMKTMNPVSAPVAGRIAEIYVHNGQPVEFGEPLMRIE